MRDSRTILHVFPSFEVGGSQRRLATYLASSQPGFRHFVYAMDGCYDAAALSDRLEQADLHGVTIPKTSFTGAVRACRRALRRVRPDLLVTYNWGSVEWVCANRWPRICPMIQIQDGFGDDEVDGEKMARRWLRRRAYQACDHVVVPSRGLEHLARESWHIKDQQLTYIPNGVDLKRFGGHADTGLLADLGLSPGQPIIGTVARLTPEKNVGRLIEAFSYIENKHTDARLVIVGDGVGRSALRMLAERICEKERVIFTGALERPERLLPAFDIFALSSDTEQMPISVLEAMAAGKPVASTDVGDIKQMVAQSNVGLIDGHDAQTLAASLDTLLADPGIGKAIGAANLSIAQENFSLETMVQSYDRLFKRTAG